MLDWDFARLAKLLWLGEGTSVSRGWRSPPPPMLKGFDLDAGGGCSEAALPDAPEGSAPGRELRLMVLSGTSGLAPSPALKLSTGIVTRVAVLRCRLRVDEKRIL